MRQEAARVRYLVVAAAWAACMVNSLQSLGDGGMHSRRDLHKFLLPLLGPSGLLVACALTSRSSTLGYLSLGLGGSVWCSS